MPRYRAAYLILLAAIGSLGLAIAVSTESMLSPGLAPDPNARILLVLGEQHLSVPAGFLTDKGRNEKLDADNMVDGIAFDFWMPEKRYVETARAIVGYRPAEPNWPPPSSDMYVVTVLSLKPISADPDGYGDPRRRFENSVRLIDPKKLRLKDMGFGLTQYWSDDDNDTATINRNYITPSGESMQALVECGPETPPAPYPLCRAWVRLYDENIYLYIFIPTEKLNEFTFIISSIRELYSEWKIQ